MTDLKLIIGNKNYSSWSLRAWLFLKHFNIPFEEILIPLRTSTSEEEIAKYTPAGKVPVLLDQELAVWDSFAIIEYLAEKYKDKPVWPDDIKKRAHARSICAEMHSGFLDLRNEMLMSIQKVYKNFKPSARTEQDIKRIKEIWNNCLNKYQADGPWLFGKFSIADCVYAPVALRFITYDTKLNQHEADYVQNIKNHPAIIEWITAAKKESLIVIDGKEY